MKLRTVSYAYKSDFDKKTSLGLIAQQTEKVIPEVAVATKDAQKIKAINDQQLIPVLIKAIQAQQKIIEAQQSEMDGLKAENKQFGKFTSQSESNNNN